MRYIELNPVRAAMVDDPAHYRWTSFRTNGLGQANALITPHAVFLALGASPAKRQNAYRALFRTGLDQPAIDDLSLAMNQNQPLGGSRFLASIAKRVGERREARPRGRPRMKKTGDDAGGRAGDAGVVSRTPVPGDAD